MNGGFGLTGQSPSTACRSVWQTPLVMSFTSACPGPGDGTGTLSMVRSLPNEWTTAAFMVVMWLSFCLFPNELQVCGRVGLWLWGSRRAPQNRSAAPNGSSQKSKQVLEEAECVLGIADQQVLGLLVGAHHHQVGLAAHP